ncbi:MAG: hydantoinase/oxoprolinase family protein [Pirellulales bacterium]
MMNEAAQPRPDVLALDIGGANIKAADGAGWSASVPFAMWREPQRLTDAVSSIIRGRTPQQLVVTMTGEIADCFSSRAAGVRHIVESATAAATACGCGDPGIYLTDGQIVTPAEAVARPLAAAASNWHAVARLAAASLTMPRGLLIDIGSTTTEIVSLVAGQPAPLASDDAGRMLSGELVYTGVDRSPLPAIVRRLPHGPIRRPIAAERFAESRDAWLLLGGLEESVDVRDTADGEPFTREASRIRIARTMLVEPADLSEADALKAAAWCGRAQARLIARALQKVIHDCGWQSEQIVISGHGERLARQAIEQGGWSFEIVSLPTILGPDVSRSAPAHALAMIARGMLP